MDCNIELSKNFIDCNSEIIKNSLALLYSGEQNGSRGVTQWLSERRMESEDEILTDVFEFTFTKYHSKSYDSISSLTDLD